MNFKRISEWLLTPFGKNVMMWAACSTTVGVFCVQAFPNTIFLHKYKELIQLYQSGIEVPVNKMLQERFKKALDLAEVKEQHKHLFEPFSVIGFDIFSAGSSYSKYGCIIGFPVNFSYTDVYSINKHDIKIQGESVGWGLEEADQLLDSLVLSENAQIYAMTREIKMRQSPKPLFDLANSTISVIGVYGMSLYFNTRLNLYARPMFFRGILYALVTAFVGGNYFFAKDYSQVYFEKKIDNELKMKNPTLREGGLEFYTKILERNKALRKLMGKEGEHNFTVMGNENYLLRQRHLPLIHRKEFFEMTEAM